MTHATGTPDELHELLEQLDTEGTVVALEARVRDLEQELERADGRALEAERARQGDLEMMRARTQDALELVRLSMEEQRVAFQRFEDRFTGLVAAAESAGRQQLGELRDDLSPMVQRALVHSDELAADLKGEIAAVVAEAARLSQAAAELDSDQEQLAARLEGVGERLGQERADREAAVEAVEDQVAQQFAAVEEATRYRLLEERGRVEALRRELDAAIGELRAGIGVKAGELVERIESNRVELVERIDRQERAVVDLDERFGTAVARRSGELDPIHRSTDELRSRVEALEAKVSEAIGGLAGSLSNRVGEVAGRLQALHEAAVRQEQRLGTIDQLERRVGELAMRRSEPAVPGVPDERVDDLVADVHALRHRERSIAERFDRIERYLRELTMRLPGAGDGLEAADGLRHEIRDLAARTAEIATRLGETDRIARTAGQAVTKLVRDARPSPPVAPALVERPGADDGPEGEEPLFGGRRPGQ